MMLMASAAVCSEAMVLLFIHCFNSVALILRGVCVFGPCFVLRCLVSFLVLQSYRRERGL